MKLIIKQTALLLMMVFIANLSVKAQTNKTNKLAVGINLSHLYDVKFRAYDQLANGFSGQDPYGLNGSKTKFDLGYGLNVMYFFSPLVSIDLSYTKGKMTGANEVNYYKSDVSLLCLSLNYDLKGRNRNKPYTWVPYLRGSIGRSSYDTHLYFKEDDVNFANTQGSTLMTGFGAGLRYHLTDNLFLNLQSEFIVNYTDAWDGYNYGSGRDHMVKTELGLKYSFGSGKHEDRGIAWNFSGNSNAGVSEEQLNKLLKVVADSMAKTNQELAALKAENQSLQRSMTQDTDGDGVPDIKDLCPNEKGSQANGCNPVASAEPVKAEPKPVAVVAQPVPVPAPAPAPAPAIGDRNELKQMLEIEMNRIYFASNSTTLSDKDKAILGNAARIMKANTSYKLKITGHTDQYGTPAYNNKLSRKRADVVAAYLTSLGIAKDRLTTQAAGNQNPRIEGKSKMSNAENRRVEFEVF